MGNKAKKIRLNIGGMTCVNCQKKIEKKLNHTNGIISASVSYNNATADILYDGRKISPKNMIAVIEQLGYDVISDEKDAGQNIFHIIGTLAIIILLYIILQSMGILNLLVPTKLADTTMGYGMLFLIGLITSVHCIAMCGGINLSQCIPDHKKGMSEEAGRLTAFRPALLYNAGRVVSYTTIGFVLGFVGFLIGGGTEVGISTLLQGILKMAAGIIMVIMGINMLELFPWLRRFTVRVPAVLSWIVGRQRSKTNRPFIVGLLNGIMPCGPLQSMWIVALASGNPFSGALAMFLFSLGTVPFMLGLGSIVSALGRKFTQSVMRVGAILVVVMGLAMFSQGSSLSGWFPSDLLPIGQKESENTNMDVVDGVQIINSTLSSYSYPNITVQAGVPVKWIINAPEGSINGCNNTMIIQEYGISYRFHTGENIIEFTPSKMGTVRYTCWMGMIQGNIFVTDADGNGAQDSESGDSILTVPEINDNQLPSCCD